MLNAKNGQEIKKLIEMGHDINYCDRMGYSFLHKAIFKNDINLVRCLLENGINIHKKDFKGNPPLFYIRNDKMAQVVFDVLGPQIFTHFDENNQNLLAINPIFKNKRN